MSQQIRKQSAVVHNRHDFRLLNMSKAFDAKAAKRLKRKERWAGIIGLFAVVFLWRAIWDWSEQYFTSNGSFVIGVLLVIMVAWLNKEHVKELL